MPSFSTIKRRLSNVLFWSIISAAFIGPGTVTTAAKAGANFGLALLFALLFSTIATVVLQEAAARITIASGKNLGEILAFKYQAPNNQPLKIAIFLAVAIGCAAYQAGNMLGAVVGIELISDIGRHWLVLSIGLLCFGLLWIGSLQIIAKVLGCIVAFMGIAFIIVALQADVTLLDFVQGLVIPHFSDHTALLFIALIGTTIVPYNLFLASGISKGQSISEMRWGIGLAVIIGGAISMAILVVGTQIIGDFSFQNLANILAEKLGKGGAFLFAFGLFAAGLSSSVTSPLAAAVTAQSLFDQNNNWGAKTNNFRLVWGVILVIGLIFGVSAIKPIPVIILAQAINGALLPIIAIFILLIVNDEDLIPEGYQNTKMMNLLTLLIVGVSSFLGIINFLKALQNFLPQIGIYQNEIGIFGAVLIVLFLIKKVIR